eukprot:CAMPEP_0115733070 /NCGR_PEP_ID=MMETSP0272-20121206/85463_1 /TAXON_ID=71861 /ORGANISM="Scrippsiella trochoidea, Strain CCMP3099" /LENGTH=139 /DNA_ID=CAMNT_0003177031 /DNA_START=824 /DNA_END=1240 /DNA_ORIENTATION=+
MPTFDRRVCQASNLKHLSSEKALVHFPQELRRVFFALRSTFEGADSDGPCPADIDTDCLVPRADATGAGPNASLSTLLVRHGAEAPCGLLLMQPLDGRMGAGAVEANGRAPALCPTLLPTPALGVTGKGGVDDTVDGVG